MTIRPDDPRLTAFVLGELDETERREIEFAIANSKELSAEIEAISALAESLRRALQSEPLPRLTSTQEEVVLAKSKTGGRAERGNWTRTKVLAGIAASIVVAALALQTMPWWGGRPSELEGNRMQGGQAQTGRVIGVVTDPAGAPIPGATVVLQPEATNEELRRSSDKRGQFVFSETPVGRANLTSQLTGFRRRRDQIEIAPGTEVSVNAVLEVGSVGEVAEVFGKAEPAAAPPALEKSPLAPAPPDDSSFSTTVPDVAFNTESNDRIVENPFIKVAVDPRSTFSIDVDTASYTNVRRFLTQGVLPPEDAVRIEEFVNYFDYDYPPPRGEHPFSVQVDSAAAPWAPTHRLVRIGLKGVKIPRDNRPDSNLVFLIDVSGSMQSPDKLPLLKAGLRMLVQNLSETDRVAVVVYAGASGLVLPSTPGTDRTSILSAIQQLEAGGSTNGGAGIQLAYQTAVDHFIEGGVNRVILATDGDFNVGVSSRGELGRLIEEKRKSGVFLSVLGFGTGNYKDSSLEELADTGNGNYAYIDSTNEARKVLVEEINGTLVTIAKDVKIQVEFNPAEVAAYRLIGYENRVLAHQDFNDDRKDAGEIGAGHTVTAFYEVVPVGVEDAEPSVDPLKYQVPTAPTVQAITSGELLTVKLRYKFHDSDESNLLEVPFHDRGQAFESASDGFRFAASVAAFGMRLRDSAYAGDLSYADILQWASRAIGKDPGGYRTEFLELVSKAQEIASGRDG